MEGGEGTVKVEEGRERQHIRPAVARRRHDVIKSLEHVLSHLCGSLQSAPHARVAVGTIARENLTKHEM